MKLEKGTRKCSPNSRQNGWIKTLGIVFVVLGFGMVLWETSRIFSRTALAASPEIERQGGARLLPPMAKPHDYSLARAASATAVFNTSDHSGSVVPAPDTPFQMLYTSTTNTFDVNEGEIVYVPILDIDDSPPIIGDFPAAAFGNGEEDDSNGRRTLLKYVYGESEIGLDSAEIKVDGKVFSLGSDYVVGVTTPALSDGGGTHYIVIGGFLSGLKKGAHIVEIDAAADGAALVALFGGPFTESITYTVNVH